MGLPTLTWQFSVGIFLIVSLAQTQPTSGAVATAPDNTASVGASFQYHSVFAQYQLFNEQQVLPWKNSNDTVGKIGGWRFYAREASQPDAAGNSTHSKPDLQVKPPAGPHLNDDPHTGHGGTP